MKFQVIITYIAHNHQSLFQIVTPILPSFHRYILNRKILYFFQNFLSRYEIQISLIEVWSWIPEADPDPVNTKRMIRYNPTLRYEWSFDGCHGIQTSILLKWYDTYTSLLANGSTAFIWKLCCHWLKSLWSHYKCIMFPRQAADLDMKEIKSHKFQSACNQLVLGGCPVELLW